MSKPKRTSRNVYIVEPSPKSGYRSRLSRWIVRAQKTGSVWGFMYNKQEAIDKGRELATLSAERGEASRLVIKKLDGTVQKEYTYPRKPIERTN